MSLPPLFEQQLCALLGETEAGALCTTLDTTTPPTSIRINPLRGLSAAFTGEVPVPWCKAGRLLTERPSFTFDPRLHTGAYYVQEAASMFVAQAYRRIAGERTPRRLLDLCAAPGGKSTLWRSLLPEGALLVANEPMRQRAQILAENLTKWGHPDVITTQAFPEEWSTLADFFDVVAADVPCSGEGMFRKDTTAREEWSAGAVVHCAERQRQIIADIWPSLRTNGFLVYSTCTFNRAENEDNVDWICRTLGAEPVEIPTEPEWGISGDTTGRSMPVYHFFPHRTQGEGFFLALLRKTAEAPAPTPRRKGRAAKPAAPLPDTLRTWLHPAEDYQLFRPTPETVAAMRRSLSDDRARIAQQVRVLTAGVLLAEEKGRKLIPQHALALSTARAAAAFPLVSVDHPTALAYLRREAINLPDEAPRGYVVLTFEGLPLGFANNLGTRANNLYPSEWRIRSSHTPDTAL